MAANNQETVTAVSSTKSSNVRDETISRPQIARSRMATGSSWRQKIEQKLESVQGEIQQGPWDPLPMLKSPSAVKKFFSGYEMGTNILQDRQSHSRWAIEEVLKLYGSEKSFETTGEVMQGKMIRYGHGQASIPKQVIQAITVDSFQDIDFDDANRSNVKDGDCKLTQTVGSAAQALFAASHNSLGPPISCCAKYLRMKKCGEYGRDKMTVWRNTKLFPALTGENGSKGLLDTQITAIVFLLSRLLGDLPKLKALESPASTRNRMKLRGPRYSGAILADSMGLGKTLTVVALLDLIAGRKLNVKIKDGQEMHYPILLLAPSIMVAGQWADELVKSSSSRSIRRILVTGGTEANFPTDYRVRWIPSIYFRVMGACGRSLPGIPRPENPEASKTVLITSISTWAHRTCFFEENEWHSTFTDLGQEFSLVVVDEAHCVKNPATKAAKSVLLLEKEWTILITATPCLNSITGK
jgi:hypothetical protein